MVGISSRYGLQDESARMSCSYRYYLKYNNAMTMSITITSISRVSINEISYLSINLVVE